MLAAVVGARHHATPGAPTALSSTGSTSSSVTITWSPPTTGGALDAGSYTVQSALHNGTFSTFTVVPYCTPNTGTITDAFGNVWRIANGSATSAIFVNNVEATPTNNVTLMYRVGGTIWQFGGGSWYSYTPSGTISNPANLAWVGPTTANPLVVTITGLSNGQSYDFRVNVSSSAGAGPYAQITASATGPVVTAINLSNLTVGSGLTPPVLVGTISVTMSSGSFSGTLVVNDTTHFAISSSSLNTAASLATQNYPITINATPTGGVAFPQNFTIAAQPIPGAVTGLSAPSVTSTSVTLSWVEPATGGPLDHGAYQVQYQIGAGAFTSGPTIQYCTAQSGSVTDSFGNIWSIGVSGPNGVYVNGVYASPTNAVDLLYLVNGSIWQRGNGLWYSIIPAQNYGGTPPSNWSGGTATDPLTSVLVSGLTASTTYNFQVRVSNSFGNGSWSGSLQATTSGAVANAISYVIGYGGGAHGQGTTSQAPIPAEETWLGRQIDIRESVAVSSSGFVFGPFASSDANKLIGMGVAFEILDQNGGFPNSMTAAAAGTYDSLYNAMITSMKNMGCPIISCRIGWEMNGNWYPWSSDGPTYIAAFRHISAMIHAQMPGTLVEWCVNLGLTGGRPTTDQFFPGKYDASTNPGGCDVMGMDWYEATYGTWSNILNASYGVNWMAGFAASNGIPMCFSEVGLGTGGGDEEGGSVTGDNAALTNSMIQWIDAQGNNFLYCNASTWVPSADLSNASRAPNITGALHTRYSGTHFDRTIGGWWTGPKLPSEP